MSSARAAIVTGGSTDVGRAVAQGLGRRGLAIVVVYLDGQRRAEATVEAVLAVSASAVAVRADLGDELDVERLFGESAAAFGGVDLIVHTASEDGSILYRYAARHLRQGGLILTAEAAQDAAETLASVDRWLRL